MSEEYQGIADYAFQSSEYMAMTSLIGVVVGILHGLAMSSYKKYQDQQILVNS